MSNIYGPSSIRKNLRRRIEYYTRKAEDCRARGVKSSRNESEALAAAHLLFAYGTINPQVTYPEPEPMAPVTVSFVIERQIQYLLGVIPKLDATRGTRAGYERGELAALTLGLEHFKTVHELVWTRPSRNGLCPACQGIGERHLCSLLSKGINP